MLSKLKHSDELEHLLQKSIKHLSLLVAFRQTMFQIKPLLSAKTLGVINAVDLTEKNKYQ